MADIGEQIEKDEAFCCKPLMAHAEKFVRRHAGPAARERLVVKLFKIG